MVRLELKTGMRPGELCDIRTCDIDRSGDIWMYRPPKHKTAHHGIEREIFIGAAGQKILAPFLKLDLQAPIFSPVDAEAVRHDEQHEKRQTPMQPSQIERAERNKSRKRRCQPGNQYTPDSYRRAVARACELAFPPPPGTGQA